MLHINPLSLDTFLPFLSGVSLFWNVADPEYSAHGVVVSEFEMFVLVFNLLAQEIVLVTELLGQTCSLLCLGKHSHSLFGKVSCFFDKSGDFSLVLFVLFFSFCLIF